MASLGEENQNLNQYWYSPHTIASLVGEVKRLTVTPVEENQLPSSENATAANNNNNLPSFKCGFLSTPSLYFSLDPLSVLRRHSKLFEFDSEKYGSDPNFVFYDFNKPEEVPPQFLGAFDFLVVDPPFITPDVWSKYITTVKLLIKQQKVPPTEADNGVARSPIYLGHVLFTSVIENHSMLEELLDAPLFVPLFRPSIPHLTYQYHCFVNYPLDSNCCLEVANPEVTEPEDPKLRSALRLANDMRESSEAFVKQMRCRNRDAEIPLPKHRHAPSVSSEANSTTSTALRVEETEEGTFLGASNSSEGEALKFRFIPEHLKPFLAPKDLNTQQAQEFNMTLHAETEKNPLYIQLTRRRQRLDVFKKGIDTMQSLLDVLLRHHEAASAHVVLVALTLNTLRDIQPEKVVEGQQQPATTTTDTSRNIIHTLQLMMSVLLEEDGGIGSTSVDVGFVSVIRNCLTDYSSLLNVSLPHASTVRLAAHVSKETIKTFAADATRKYKSPIFNKQKQLLEEIKKCKQEIAKGLTKC